VDPVSREEKSCNYDCVYCRLGRTEHPLLKREYYVSVESMLGELLSIPRVYTGTIVFSGRGEPTLAGNLEELISAVRKVRDDRISVITNGSLLNREDVEEDLTLADVVITKLDPCSERTFLSINRPAGRTTFETVFSGLEKFRHIYTGYLILQIMFLDANVEHAGCIASLADRIRPDEVQLNTPMETCTAAPVSRDVMARVRSLFTGRVRSIYDAGEENVSHAG
jgi:wyosine [tRNA(Phe)-imidazoG37] synthetase (radical SAM superfamily)